LNDPKTKEIIPDPATFSLVQLAFKEYGKGSISYSELGKKLRSLGLINQTGNPLSGSQVQQMLTDPFYYGAFMFSGELHQGNHKPAVTKSLWDQVQSKMRNRGKPKKFKKQKHYYAFRGIMTCAACGRLITPEVQKRNNYYHCTRRLDEGGYCTPYVNEKELTSQFESLMDSVMLPDDWIELTLAELDKLENTRESRLKARLAKLDDELDVIQSRLSRLADLYISHEIDRADYTARKAVLVNQKVINAEARKELAKDRGSRMLEPARRPLKLVQDWKNAPAGDDLGKLRDFVTEVVSNLTLDSRKVLWDWIQPFGLFSNSRCYTEWLG
jgi:hypothetical protein